MDLKIGALFRRAASVFVSRVPQTSIPAAAVNPVSAQAKELTKVKAGFERINLNLGNSGAMILAALSEPVRTALTLYIVEVVRTIEERNRPMLVTLISARETPDFSAQLERFQLTPYWKGLKLFLRKESETSRDIRLEITISPSGLMAAESNRSLLEVVPSQDDLKAHFAERRY